MLLVHFASLKLSHTYSFGNPYIVKLKHVSMHLYLILSVCMYFFQFFVYVQVPIGENRIQANGYSDTYLQSNLFQGKENFIFITGHK